MKGRRKLKKTRIEAQPLIDAIERRGGLVEVLTRAGVETFLEDGKTPTLAHMRQEARLRDGKERGWIDYYIADEVSIELLGMHPVQIWGEHWFTAPDDHDHQHRLRDREIEELVA